MPLTDRLAGLFRNVRTPSPEVLNLVKLVIKGTNASGYSLVKPLEIAVHLPGSCTQLDFGDGKVLVKVAEVNLEIGLESLRIVEPREFGSGTTANFPIGYRAAVPSPTSAIASDGSFFYNREVSLGYGNSSTNSYHNFVLGYVREELLSRLQQRR